MLRAREEMMSVIEQFAGFHEFWGDIPNRARIIVGSHRVLGPRERFKAAQKLAGGDLMSFGMANALAIMSRHLSEAPIPPVIAHHEEGYGDEHLICLGGPAANKVSAHYLTKWQRCLPLNLGYL